MKALSRIVERLGNDDADAHGAGLPVSFLGRRQGSLSAGKPMIPQRGRGGRLSRGSRRFLSINATFSSRERLVLKCHDFPDVYECAFAPPSGNIVAMLTTHMHFVRIMFVFTFRSLFARALQI